MIAAAGRRGRFLPVSSAARLAARAARLDRGLQSMYSTPTTPLSLSGGKRLQEPHTLASSVSSTSAGPALWLPAVAAGAVTLVSSVLFGRPVHCMDSDAGASSPALVSTTAPDAGVVNRHDDFMEQAMADHVLEEGVLPLAATSTPTARLSTRSM